MTSGLRPEAEIFEDLRGLCTSSGYIHAIAYFSWRDNLIPFLRSQGGRDAREHLSAHCRPQKHDAKASACCFIPMREGSAARL
jgi:hypothetical protein